MEEFINLKYVYGAVIYSGLGLIIITVSYVAFEVMTPKFNLWQELVEKKNTAMAIFMAAIIIGMSLIISSAIHG